MAVSRHASTIDAILEADRDSARSHAVELAIKDLELRFGGLVALRDLSFTVPPEQLCAVVGPNGAGKSSLFNCIGRLYKPTKGTIRLGDEVLTEVAAHLAARAGVARTFQNLALLPTLTVTENVLLGGHLRHRHRLVNLGAALRLPREVGAERQLRREAAALIDRMGLTPVAAAKTSELSFGTLKHVEVARALMSRPRLLLLDEPAAGLTEREVMDLGRLVRDIRDEFRLTVLLVEHHMGLVTTISDRVVVLNAGRLIADGPPDQVVRNPDVIAAYLG
jgi:branched-chain amino acid transport system ATP-binding protein